MDREAFDADVSCAAKRAGLKLAAPIKTAVFAALGERDPKAAICRDGKSRPEPDSELHDTENIPLASAPYLCLPLVIAFSKGCHVGNSCQCDQIGTGDKTGLF